VKDREIHTRPPGEGKTIKDNILEIGAGLIQDVAPIKQFDIYVVGFHCGRDHPDMQMEAHHYCRQVNAEFFQCVIFDGNTRNANLIGIEYIISERLFDNLPEEEKAYWHPHNYEVFSGELVAPGLPDAVEKAMLKSLVNSYGKTWHTWHTGRYDQPGSGRDLPFGDPMLMWSFNREGEADVAMKKHRDEAMRIDPEKKKRDRQDLIELAHPQRRVDLLKGAFPGAAAEPPPGVVDAGIDPR
jgi:hypothetical protein